MSPQKQNVQRRGEPHALLALLTVLGMMLTLVGALEYLNYATQTKIASNLAYAAAISMSAATRFSGNGVESYSFKACSVAEEVICRNINCNSERAKGLEIICTPTVSDFSFKKSRHTTVDIYLLRPYYPATGFGRIFGDRVVGYAPATLSFGILNESE